MASTTSPSSSYGAIYDEKNGNVIACAYQPASKRPRTTQEEEVVECKEWGTTNNNDEDQSLLVLPPQDDDDNAKDDEKRNICVAILTLVVSIPTIIGMWCWPALVIPLLGGTVTSASRHFSHWLNLGLDVIMLSLVLGFVWHQSKNRRQTKSSSSSSITTTSHWQVYGPTYLVAIASLLILADPMRHVLQDMHWLRAPMYISNCPVRALQIPTTTCEVSSDCGSHDCGNGFYSVHPGEDCFTCWKDTGLCSEGAETFRCLSAIGWMFTIVATYFGFGLFFVAVLWNSNLVGKFQKQWQNLRR